MMPNALGIGTLSRGSLRLSCVWEGAGQPPRQPSHCLSTAGVWRWLGAPWCPFLLPFLLP